MISPDAYDLAMPITLAILFLLFMAQRFGTGKVSILFSPMLSLWFLALFCFGIYNITLYPRVLRAFSPWFAFDYFIRNGYTAWVSLGAVVLCIAGAEAMYADIGHFSARAVRISFLSVVYPSLLMTYCGQAVTLILDPTAITSTFYRSLPPGFLTPMVVLATIATIIASQALISASFSLVMQAMRLNCFPRVTIIHTDARHEGQIYIPEVNYALMIGCLAITAAFQHSSNLTVAYGIAVCTVMLIDMLFYAVAIPVVFRKPWVLGVLFVAVYMIIDVSFFTANLLKFVSGGWFPLVLTAILSTMMILWRWGRGALTERMNAMALADDQLTFRRVPDVFSERSKAVLADRAKAPWPLNAPDDVVLLREKERAHGRRSHVTSSAASVASSAPHTPPRSPHQSSMSLANLEAGISAANSNNGAVNSSSGGVVNSSSGGVGGVSAQLTRALSSHPEALVTSPARQSVDKSASDEPTESVLRQRPSALRRLTFVRDQLSTRALNLPPAGWADAARGDGVGVGGGVANDGGSNGGGGAPPGGARAGTVNASAEAAADEGEPLPVVPGVFFYFSSSATLVPASFVHLIGRIPIRPQFLVFITIETVNHARVEDDMNISKVGNCEGVYRTVIRLGYAQDVPDMAIMSARILRLLRYIPPSLQRLHHASMMLGDIGPATENAGDHRPESPPALGHGLASESATAQGIALGHALASESATATAAQGLDHDRESVHTTADEVAEWASDDAYVAAANPTLLMGHDVVFAREGSPWWHRWRVAAFSWLTNISRTQRVAMRIPASNSLEVGFRVDI